MIGRTLNIILFLFSCLLLLGTTLKWQNVENLMRPKIETHELKDEKLCQTIVPVRKVNIKKLVVNCSSSQNCLVIKNLAQISHNLSMCTYISLLSQMKSIAKKMCDVLSLRDYYTSNEVLNESNNTKTFTRYKILTFNNVFTVYSLYDVIIQNTDSSTQATGAMNKCLQVHCKKNDDPQWVDVKYTANSNFNPSAYASLSTISTSVHAIIHQHYMQTTNQNPEVYFFGHKKCSNICPTSSAASQTKFKKCKGICSKKSKKNMSPQIMCTTSTSQQTTCMMSCSPGTCSATNTGKSVSIKDDLRCPKEKPCPYKEQNNIIATVSHIKLGPKTPCPVHGLDCPVPNTAEDKAPVKVSGVSNPRRGVFELVIRRINGAPLAKNELMLEWTPPPIKCLSPCCGAACVIPIPCRSKCKTVSCRSRCKGAPCKVWPCKPSPCRPTCYPVPCTSRCKVAPCRNRCQPVPCRSRCMALPCISRCKAIPCGSRCMAPPCIPKCRPKLSCRSCYPCTRCSGCGSPCRRSPCRKCSPSKKCPMAPCSPPCNIPCPGSRKPCRRCCSQPKIKPRSRRVSPCRNRSFTCRLVKCRSLPGPCISSPCCPRASCSVVPCTPPPRYCKSKCSSCCVRPC